METGIVFACILEIERIKELIGIDKADKADKKDKHHVGHRPGPWANRLDLFFC